MPILNELAVRLSADVKNFNAGMQSAADSLNTFAQRNRTVGQAFDNMKASIRNAPAGLALVGTAAVAAATAIVKLTLSSAKMADQTRDDAIRIGTTTEALSQLRFAAEQSGVSQQNLTLSLQTMNIALGEAINGGKEAVESFTRIGLSTKDLQTLAPDQIFERVADGLKSIPSAAERAAIAQRIFGRGAKELKPLMEEGSKGIRALRAEADQLGITISTGFADKSDEFFDNVGRLTAVTKAFGLTIAEQVLPVLNSLLEALIDITKSGVKEFRWAFFELNFQLQRGFAHLGKLVAMITRNKEMVAAYDAIINETRGDLDDWIKAQGAAIAAAEAAAKAAEAQAAAEAAAAEAIKNKAKALTQLVFAFAMLERKRVGKEAPVGRGGEAPITPEGAAQPIPINVEVSGWEIALGEAQIFFDSVTDLSREAFGAMDRLAANLGQGLVAAATGAKVKFGEFFAQMLKDLAAAIARALFLRIILGLIPGLGAAMGAIQGFIGGPLGGGGIMGPPLPASAPPINLGRTGFSAPEAMATSMGPPTIIAHETTPMTWFEIVDRNIIPRLRDRRDDFGAEGF